MAIKMKKNLANRSNYGNKRSLNDIKYIVIHYTGNDGDTDENNGKYFNNNVVKVSSHYFVDDDSVTQSVPDNYIAWAVGGSKYASCPSTGGGTAYGKCTNANSISIEICDDVKNGKVYPSDKTIANVIELIKYLMKEYDIPASKVIRHFDVTGKLCLPIDTTELLTKKGWVKLGEINVGDVVAQYNEKKETIEFESVIDVVKPYESETLKNRDLEATVNHRMFLVPNAPNSNKYREVLWGDALEGNKVYLIKNGAMYNGKGLDLSDDEIRMIVWAQGDGHYMKNRKGEIVGVEFHLKKERKISRVKELFESLGIKYTVCNKTDGSVSLRNYGKEFYEWLERVLANKTFDYNLLEMNHKQFEVFWSELVIVDGNAEKNLYTSSIAKNLDVVQALCAINDARTVKCTLGGKDKVAIERIKSNYSVGGHSKTKIIISRKTTVSCVTVPSGYILIRQNGKTFIVGNCPAYWCGTAKKNQKWKDEFWNKLEEPKKEFKNGNYNGKVKTTANLNVRAGRGTDYKILGTLPKGTVVEALYILKKNGSYWASIDYGKTVGYICLDYVEKM